MEKTITNKELDDKELHWVKMNKFYSKLSEYYELCLQAKTSGKKKNGGVDPFIMINRCIIYEEDE